MALLNEADAIHLGPTMADRVYLGATLVWQQTQAGLQPPSGITATTSGTLAAPTDVQAYSVGGGV